MARRKIKITKPKKDAFAIIVDGETEVWYFQMLKRNEPSLQVNIEPKIPQKKKLSEQYRKVLELAEDFTKVFWIIDLDVVIAESKAAKKGGINQIQELKNYLNELENEKYKNVITIFNNPCLEFWFLLHFEQTTKYFSKCSNAEKQLKKQLTNYEKTQRYFTKQNNDIYLKLKSRLSTALKNAQKTKRGNINEIEHAICEMNLFFETEQIKTIID
ncbi:MAG: RloB domain-containing protein [Bacteroidales bacterium]|nr:RloB domain-containing protein [Bacteroidales bacterium]